MNFPVVYWMFAAIIILLVFLDLRARKLRRSAEWRAEPAGDTVGKITRTGFRKHEMMELARTLSDTEHQIARTRQAVENEIQHCMAESGERKMVTVTEVSPLPGFRLSVRLSDGRCGVFDVKPYLDKGVFRELKDPGYFNGVQASFGGVSWPHGQDFGPGTIEVEMVGDVRGDRGDIETSEIKDIIRGAFRDATQNYAMKEDLALVKREINQCKQWILIQFGILMTIMSMISVFLVWFFS